MWLAEQEPVILDCHSNLRKEVHGTQERMERICTWLQMKQERGQKPPA